MRSTSRPSLWNLDYSLTLLGTFSFFGSFFYLLSVLPDYIDEIGGEAWHIGIIVGGFNVIPLFIRPLVGRWSDHGHRLRMMQISLVVFAGSLLLMVWSEDVWSLLGLRVVQGIGMAMFPTAAGSLIAEIVPMPRRGEGVGFFGMATSLSQMAFPALGVVIAQVGGFDAVFIVSAATALISILIVLPISEPSGVARRTRISLAGLLPRPAAFPMVIFLTVTFSFSAASAFLPLLSDERDLGNVGLYFLVGGAFAVVTRPVAGRASDRFGRVPVILPGLIISALGMWTLTQADGLPVMLLAGAFGGVGLGSAHTGLFALALDRVSDTQRGGATAVFQYAWDLGGLIGSGALGFVASAIDVQTVFWVAGVVIFAGSAGLLFGHSVGWTRSYRDRVARPLLPAIGLVSRPSAQRGAAPALPQSKPDLRT